MNRAERIYKIRVMLEGGKPVPMARLISTLEVSRPTIRRDLEYILQVEDRGAVFRGNLPRPH